MRLGRMFMRELIKILHLKKNKITRLCIKIVTDRKAYLKII